MSPDLRVPPLSIARMVAVMFCVMAASGSASAHAGVQTLGSTGTGDGQFDRIRGVDTDAAGNVYVADAASESANRRIQKFGPDGTYLGQYPVVTGRFGVSDLAATADGQVYAVHTDPPSIQRYDVEGAPASNWAIPNFDWGHIATAAGAGTDVYFSNYHAGTVTRFSPTGVVVASFPVGTNPGDVAVDALGRVYVEVGGMIRTFDPEGTLLASWPTNATGHVQFLDISRGGEVYVSGYSAKRFSSTGTLLGSSRRITEHLAVGPGPVVWAASENGRRLLRIDRLPTASIESDATTIATSERITFSGQGSHADFAPITMYEWDFDGNGTFDFASDSTSSATHRYDSRGTYEVRLRVTEQGGLSATTTQSVTVEDSVATLVPSHGLVSTGQVLVLDASSSVLPRSSITDVSWDLDGNGSYERSSGSNLTTEASYQAVGIHTAAVRVTRAGGRVDTASARIEVRLAPAAGPLGISINGGDRYTKNPNVAIEAVWPNLAATMFVSNDGGFAQGVRTPVMQKLAWTLDSTGPERLPQTVYVRFEGGESGRETYQDDIILDQTDPLIVAANAVVVSAPGPSPARAAGKARKLRITTRATDATSGLGGIQLTTNRARPGAWKAYSRASFLSVSARTRVVYARVTDRAGNTSRWRTIRIAR